ncbi:P-loop containing nucleoside triphosphate hydrolase protein [Punctularia strigosozonata HHB-11173 SS5]|uniref:P-loop containing nucleoside triphosphate hydrolase protein n=1 Tax=Punctularia strigosozonata (strain HHB-11173) TaxID=741275 RepID=UPI000441755E|nr:P-loop containing nucleoside triphosphate hydrolase protein [Punctularia strigosozonata HHB-11173 SS5]EIN11291.1 P-loop containing nucleoside triphosphate hydrolase protein [Punctularia strigosozonata HHB-11173 SS5]
MAPGQVTCPVCSQQVPESKINEHLDQNCRAFDASGASKSSQATSKKSSHTVPTNLAPIFSQASTQAAPAHPTTSTLPASTSKSISSGPSGKKRGHHSTIESNALAGPSSASVQPSAGKRVKTARTSRLEAAAPLAERLRPQSLEEFVGQPHLVGKDALLVSSLERGSVGSIILWGPPGCGKTTLARLLAKRTDAVFKELSATVVGINDVRAVFDEAKNVLQLTGRKTILFLDEIHRFTRSQQDIFLPYIEQGHIQLIGATTENPSFKVNGALLSRCRVFVLERLTDVDIERIVRQAVDRVAPPPALESAHNGPDASESHSRPSSPPSSSPTSQWNSSPVILDRPFTSSSPFPTPPSTKQAEKREARIDIKPFPAYPQLTSRILASIVSLSTGDARTAISLLELVLSSPATAEESVLLDSLRKSVSTSYDRTGDSHYDLISALHKSVRGSDPHAAMYWLARMLEAGEDPLRAIVMASEDIGLADSHALPLAIAAMQACQFVGMPECRINLAHLIAYLAEAPKSTRSYEAYNRAAEAAKKDMTLPVPLQVRNAPTKLMKELGYSEGYRYNPDYAHPVHNEYLPSELKGRVFLRPAGDVTGKIWDEAALQRWEEETGRRWEGRSNEE